MPRRIIAKKSYFLKQTFSNDTTWTSANCLLIWQRQRNHYFLNEQKSRSEMLRFPTCCSVLVPAAHASGHNVRHFQASEAPHKSTLLSDLFPKGMELWTTLKLRLFSKLGDIPVSLVNIHMYIHISLCFKEEWDSLQVCVYILVNQNQPVILKNVQLRWKCWNYLIQTLRSNRRSVIFLLSWTRFREPQQEGNLRRSLERMRREQGSKPLLQLRVSARCTRAFGQEGVQVRLSELWAQGDGNAGEKMIPDVCTGKVPSCFLLHFQPHLLHSDIACGGFYNSHPHPNPRYGLQLRFAAKWITHPATRSGTKIKRVFKASPDLRLFKVRTLSRISLNFLPLRLYQI